MEPNDHDLLVRIDERTGQMHEAIFGGERAGLLDRVTSIEAREDERNKQDAQEAASVLKKINKYGFPVSLLPILYALLAAVGVPVPPIPTSGK